MITAPIPIGARRQTGTAVDFAYYIYNLVGLQFYDQTFVIGYIAFSDVNKVQLLLISGNFCVILQSLLGGSFRVQRHNESLNLLISSTL